MQYYQRYDTTHTTRQTTRRIRSILSRATALRLGLPALDVGLETQDLHSRRMKRATPSRTRRGRGEGGGGGGEKGQEEEGESWVAQNQKTQAPIRAALALAPASRTQSPSGKLAHQLTS